MLLALLEKPAIEIVGYSASPKAHEESSIDKAFEGNDKLGREDCYVAKTEENGFAYIDIEHSAIDRIELLNRNEFGK